MIMKYHRGSSTAGGVAALALVVWAVAAWLTHVIYCIQTAQWLLLIAGAILAPIGVIHGTGVWFDAWGAPAG